MQMVRGKDSAARVGYNCSNHASTAMDLLSRADIVSLGVDISSHPFNEPAWLSCWYLRCSSLIASRTYIVWSRRCKRGIPRAYRHFPPPKRPGLETRHLTYLPKVYWPQPDRRLPEICFMQSALQKLRPLPSRPYVVRVVRCALRRTVPMWVSGTLITRLDSGAKDSEGWAVPRQPPNDNQPSTFRTVPRRTHRTSTSRGCARRGYDSILDRPNLGSSLHIGS